MSHSLGSQDVGWLLEAFMSVLRRAWVGFECDVPVLSTRRCPWVCADWSGDCEKVGSGDYWQEKTRDNWNHELFVPAALFAEPCSASQGGQTFPMLFVQV